MKDDFEQRFINYYTAHRQGQLAQAEKGYQELLKQQPDSGQVLRALGNLFLDQDQPDKAIPVFEKAAGLNPPDLSACYNLGRLRQLENDHQGAIAIYTSMLDQKPDSGLVWNNLGVAYRALGQPADAVASYKKAVRFSPDMAEAWNNLGVAQEESGEADLAEDAVYSYTKAIEIQPDYASPHLNLGVCLQKSKQFEQAEHHYRMVLKIQPDNETAAFLLQSLVGDETPDAAPVEHVRNIFDQCADHFESILVDQLAYQTPKRLFDLVRPYLSQNMAVLDLGCGTGLGAGLYRQFSKHMTGVDVSTKMLEKADEKNIYDRLEQFDVLEEWAFPEKFDLIYSSDVFVYFGNLDPIIGSASSYLVRGGHLAFSVELLEDEAAAGSYRLYPSGRYAHSQTYIQTCLDRHGLKKLKMSKTVIRKQSGHPVKGLLITAVKKSSAGVNNG